MLRPTPGDPWGVEQHHWNTGAEENQQLNLGGPSNRQKSSGPNQLKREAKFLTVIGLNTKHADCRIIFMLYPIRL